MAHWEPAFHYSRLNRVNRGVGDPDEESHYQQTTEYSRAGCKYLTRKPSGQTCADDPDHTRTSQCHPWAKQFAEYPARQLAEGIAPYEGSINPAHLDLADAELGHHELARHVDVLAH